MKISYLEKVVLVVCENSENWQDNEFIYFYESNIEGDIDYFLTYDLCGLILLAQEYFKGEN